MNVDELTSIPVSETYQKALDLFKDRSRWAQEYYQYDKDGAKCNWRDGYSFCAMGALCFFTDGFNTKALCCLQRVSVHLFGDSIQHVNDGHYGYEKVMQALEFARDLWKDHEPTKEDLDKSVDKVLEGRLNG